MKYKNTFTYSLLLFVLGVLCLSSCSFKSRDAILKTPYDADTVSNVFVVNPSAAPKDYYNLIKPEDELAISNLQDMDLIVKAGISGTSGTGNSTYTTFKVDANGEVKLPKIGSIKLAGLNRVEASSKIQQAYEAKELVAPLIDVRIANLSVILLGESPRQGKFLLERENYELIDLLGDAGGVNQNANKKMVKIFRGDRSNPEIIIVNLNNYNFLKDPRLKLRAGDIIYIEPKRLVTNSQNLQTYTSFVQIGLVVVNSLLLIYTLTK